MFYQRVYSLVRNLQLVFNQAKTGICHRKIVSDETPKCYTLSGQKYLHTAKYPCTDCAIYRLKNQLGTKMRIEICRDQKFIVIALTLVKTFDFLTFHEVLIY